VAFSEQIFPAILGPGLLIIGDSLCFVDSPILQGACQLSGSSMCTKLSGLQASENQGHDKNIWCSICNNVILN
jgi:hypothetical protein